MPGYAFDKIDIEIIRQLQEDARVPASTVADRIAVSESTVRNRLTRLISSGAIELSAWVDPEAAGHRVWVMIDLSVDMRKIDTITKQLSEIPEVYYVGVATGAYDIHSAAVFRSNDELVEFMTGRLAAIQGIQRAHTSTIIKKVKRTTKYANLEGLLGVPHRAPKPSRMEQAEPTVARRRRRR